MIGIISYISVLERTREIGIIRSLGGTRRGVVRIFNSESLVIGFIAGLFGVILVYLLNVPINMVIEKVNPELAGVALLSHVHSVILLVVSIFFACVSGYFAAVIAAKK